MLLKNVAPPFASVRPPIWIYLFLTIITLATYFPVRNYDFIAFDDDIYVSENKMVAAGLSREGLIWAFQLKEERFNSYWQPLTWLSHMLDVHIYGMNSGNHHLTNLIFHILNSLLLFQIFFRMTGKTAQSAWVALLFALHPLNVESVAWVASRKNLLSTFFGFATLTAYFNYVQKPNFLKYLLTLLFFVLGLMAKPALAMLTGVLLLLDYWPLGRLRIGRLDASAYMTHATSPVSGLSSLPLIRLLLEKLPFIIFSAVSIYLSLSMVQAYQTVVTTDLVPMSLRLANAPVSYIKYILKMLWPQKLAVFYPFPQNVPAWQVLGSIVFLSAVTISVVLMAKRKPYLLFGWLWYLGALLPVIGFVQAGLWPEMADRWAYVPLVGIFVMLAWGIPDVLQARPYKRALRITVAVCLLAVLTLQTRLQLHYWHDTTTLFRHTLRVTNNNHAIQYNLANVLERENRMNEAIEHYAMALRIKPDFATAHNAMGEALRRKNELDQAIAHYLEAIRIYPSYAQAYNNLGVALLMLGRRDEAIRCFQEAMRINPDYLSPQRNLQKVIQAGAGK